MTADEILLLSGLCGPFRPTIAREPWLRSPAKVGGLTFRPDAGWHLAGRFAKTGLLPDALQGLRFFWIRQAAEWIGGNRNFHGRAVTLLGTVKEIYAELGARRLLNGLLMASDSSAKDIASLVRCPPLAVNAYDQLFFNVLDRKHDLLYLAALCEADRVSLAGRPPADGVAASLHLDPRATMAEVMVLAGFGDSTALDPVVLQRRLGDQAFRDSGGFSKGGARGNRRSFQPEEPASHFPERGIGAILRAQLGDDGRMMKRQLEEQMAVENQNKLEHGMAREDQGSVE